MNKLVITLFLFVMLILPSSAEFIRDEFVDETLQEKVLQKPECNLEYNYNSIKRVPVKLAIIEPVSTRHGDSYDGKKLFFKVKNNVVYNKHTVIKKDTVATARIAAYTTRGMNGIPASIIVNDFKINGIDENKMTTSYTKYGLNFSAFVLPLKWALTFLPTLGTFTNFIVGTNASITSKDTITLYYYPECDERL